MVFPAHAGMSRLAREFKGIGHGFPRPRGDEPSRKGLVYSLDEFSPPTRG